MSFIYVKAIQSPSPKYYQFSQQIPKAAYYQQNLHITGLKGSGVIEIYSIIGNKRNMFVVQFLNSIQQHLSIV